jgi:hypothetical protein
MHMRVHVAQRIARRAILLSLLLIFGSIGSVSAQPAAPSEPTREQLLLQIDILKDQVKRLQARPPATPFMDDPEVLQAAKNAQKKTHEFVSASVDLSIGVLRDQRYASTAVLVLVILIVVSGILFAGFQLWKSVAVGPQPTNDLEFSAAKVRITSSVVGVTILVISLAFLYIYSKEIYVVKTIDATPQQTLAR